MDELAWRQPGIVYEAYPRSFKDSNGDGIGDLRGLIEKLDYLHWLGADAIWVQPVLRSPMIDHGYDICDYRSIDPVFGDMAAFDDLVGEVQARGLRLIFDLRRQPHLYRQLIQLRRNEPALQEGAWMALGVQGGAFLYMRVHRDRRIMVALNMTGEPRAIILRRRRLRGGQDPAQHPPRPQRRAVGDELDLRGDEGVVVALPPS